MIGYATFLGQVRLMPAQHRQPPSVPLRSARLGQWDHYDPDYPYQPGYEMFRRYNVPNGPFDVEAIPDLDHHKRWISLLQKDLATTYRLIAIPREAQPPKESYAPAWAEKMNSDYDPEKWAYRDGGIVYVFGEPLETLKHKEEAVDAGLKVVNNAVDQYTTNLEKVAELLKEIDQWLGKVRSISGAKADQLGTMLAGCRLKGASPEAIVCLEALLDEVRVAAGAPRIPTAVYVIGGGLAIAGLATYFATRNS